MKLAKTLSRKSALRMAAAIVALTGGAQAIAASDGWKGTPVDNNYNNSANFTGATVPGSGETATFGDVEAGGLGTGITNPTFLTFGSANTTVGTFSFSAPNSKYVITLDNNRNLNFTGGVGVVVSGTSLLPAITIAQGSTWTFNNGSASSVTAPNTGRVSYAVNGILTLNSGTDAGNADMQVGPNGRINFTNSSALNAKIINAGKGATAGVFFSGASATAANSSIVNNGDFRFQNGSSAGNSTITNNDQLIFSQNSTLSNSIVTLQNGGDVLFNNTSQGGTGRIVMNNGSTGETVDFSGYAGGTFNIGSIEGGDSTDSVILSDTLDLVIGGNNFVDSRNPEIAGTVYLGAKITGGLSGSITKTGTGALFLNNNSNDFIAQIIIDGGRLVIGGDGALGDTANDVDINNGAALETTANITANAGRTFTLGGTGGGTFITDNSTKFTITNAILEDAPGKKLFKAGGGVLELTGDSTGAGGFSGGSQVQAGTLRMGSGGTTGLIKGDVEVQSGAEFEIRRSNAVTYADDITGAGSFIQGGSGTTTLSGQNTYSGNTWLNSGRLIAAGGHGVGDNSDVQFNGGDFEITANETVGSLGGEGGTLYLNGFDLTLAGDLGQDTNTYFGGDITGTGGLIKNGTFEQRLYGDFSFTGDTHVNAGKLVVNGSLSGSVFVGPNGTFGGSAHVFGDLQNAGELSPGNSPGTTFVGGDYIAVGNPVYAVDVNVDKQNLANTNAGTQWDLLDVTGDYVGPATKLKLVPSNTVPVATVGDGILIARFGGDVADGKFFFDQTGPQTEANGFVDGFQYTVNTNTTTDEVFLRTGIREELVANATALATSRQVTRDCFRTGPAPASDGDGSKGRGWLGLKAGSFNSDAENGADFDNNYNCVGGGFDLPIGNGFQAGLRGGYANSDVDLKVAQGLARLDAVSFNMEAAVSYISGAFYAALTAGWGSHDWDYDAALSSGGSRSETFDGAIGSLVAGYRAPLNGNTSLTFEGLLNYDSTDCGSGCFLTGTSEDTSDWEGRLLGRIDTKFAGVMPFLQVAVSSDFDNGQTVSFGNAISQVDVAGTLLAASLGVAANLGGNWTGSFEVGTTQGLDSNVDGYHGQLGLKTRW